MNRVRFVGFLVNKYQFSLVVGRLSAFIFWNFWFSDCSWNTYHPDRDIMLFPACMTSVFLEAVFVRTFTCTSPRSTWGERMHATR